MRKGAGVAEAKFGEVARLLRSSEALARAAVAALMGMANQVRTDSPERIDGVAAASQPAGKAKAKRRGKQQKKDIAGQSVGHIADCKADIVAEHCVVRAAGPTADAPTGGTLPCGHTGDPIPVANADAPMDGTLPRRTLQQRISRERSPHPHSAQLGDDRLAVGTTVWLHDLQSRASLNGTSGSIISYDSSAGRYAVRVGNDSVRVKKENIMIQGPR